ncbi:MAG: Holliday junction resolvase RuvX [Candidatus Saccharibacteria bacterium]
MTRKISLVCLDVGEKRIGVAVGDNAVRIAVPLETIPVDGSEVNSIKKIVEDEGTDILVVGYPRNQSGEPTAQTDFVTGFVDSLKNVINVKVVFQDESLTSVIAEQRLQSFKKPYAKSDIDAMAAAIILQDFIEANYA